MTSSALMELWLNFFVAVVPVSVKLTYCILALTQDLIVQYHILQSSLRPTICFCIESTIVT